MLKNTLRTPRILFTGILASVFLIGGFISTKITYSQSSIPTPTGYKRTQTIPAAGSPSGSFGNELKSATTANSTPNIGSLPSRPFFGSETYWISTSGQERQWLQELGLDVLRVEVTAEDFEKGNDDSNPNTDFTGWTAADFEGEKKGWNFNDPDTLSDNVMDSVSSVAKFPLMMMMHYGGESYMGTDPNSDEYAEYFLATVYYYNVIKGANIKYWEVLNEPDWGWGNNYCSPTCYAQIFKRVATRIKSHPDPRVNSIHLGGPVLGSGDPIEGTYPDGYANRTSASDDGREWSKYIPTLLSSGSRTGQHDIGFLSWHDYGDTWGLPNNMYRLENNYNVINRVNAFFDLTNGYVSSGGQRPELIVSEMNFDAGTTQAEAREYYKNFYSALWHTSTLNNYLSTGRLKMLFHFFWKGRSDWPKGLVYSGPDSNNQTVRNPVYFAYKYYLDHLQEKVLAASTAKQNRWADVIATTDTTGKVVNLIAVNKSDTAQNINFSFNLPAAFSQGGAWATKKTLVAGGSGTYGSPFAEPVLSTVYQYQPVSLQSGKQLNYVESIPARTIVYYTLVSTNQQVSSPLPTPTPTPSTSTTPTPTSTPIPSATTCDADINQDGTVNIFDFSILSSNFMKTTPSNPRANINKSGKVDLADYSILATNFMKKCPAHASPTPAGQSTPTPTPQATPTSTPAGQSTPTPTPTPSTSTTSMQRLYSTSSPFNQKIPANATYTRDNEIGTFRQVLEEWSAPVYRLSANHTNPLIKITNEYSNRIENWPIPTTANPAAEADAHMIILDPKANKSYEFWAARWNGGRTEITAGGMKDFALNGNGISDPPNYRVVAAGFAISAGMVMREDFTNTQGQVTQAETIDHALTMALHFDKVKKGEYIAPAVGGETNGRAGDTPMGARFALPKDLNVDALQVHPLSRELIRAARDYGIFVNDTNGSAKYNNKYVGTIRIEPGLTQTLYGKSSDDLVSTVQQDVYKVIEQYGIYRVN